MISALLCASPVLADVVFLTDDVVPLSGTILEEDSDGIDFELADEDGSRWIGRDRIARIVRTRDLLRQVKEEVTLRWRERKRRAGEAGEDPEALVALGEWCLDNRLYQRAVEHLQPLAKQREDARALLERAGYFEREGGELLTEEEHLLARGHRKAGSRWHTPKQAQRLDELAKLLARLEQKKAAAEEQLAGAKRRFKDVAGSLVAAKRQLEGAQEELDSLAGEEERLGAKLRDMAGRHAVAKTQLREARRAASEKLADHKSAKRLRADTAKDLSSAEAEARSKRSKADRLAREAKTREARAKTLETEAIRTERVAIRKEREADRSPDDERLEREATRARRRADAADDAHRKASDVAWEASESARETKLDANLAGIDLKEAKRIAEDASREEKRARRMHAAAAAEEKDACSEVEELAADLKRGQERLGDLPKLRRGLHRDIKAGPAEIARLEAAHTAAGEVLDDAKKAAAKVVPPTVREIRRARAAVKGIQPAPLETGGPSRDLSQILGSKELHKYGLAKLAWDPKPDGDARKVVLSRGAGFRLEVWVRSFSTNSASAKAYVGAMEEALAKKDSLTPLPDLGLQAFERSRPYPDRMLVFMKKRSLVRISLTLSATAALRSKSARDGLLGLAGAIDVRLLDPEPRPR